MNYVYGWAYPDDLEDMVVCGFLNVEAAQRWLKVWSDPGEVVMVRVVTSHGEWDMSTVELVKGL